MSLHKTSIAMTFTALLAAGNALAQTALCYNCPPEWADWGTQLKAIKEKTGITVPPDNKNSGQSLAQLVAEKAAPVADVTYLGVTFGIQAKKEGVVTPYKPAAWAEIPDGLKDPDGKAVGSDARNPNYKNPTEYQTPLQVRFGARVTF